MISQIWEKITDPDSEQQNKIYSLPDDDLHRLIRITTGSFWTLFSLGASLSLFPLAFWLLSFVVLLVLLSKFRVPQILCVYEKENILSCGATIFLLGSLFSFGAQGVLFGSSFFSFRAHLLSLVIYHTGEFFFVLFYQTHLLCWNSFLIYHSKSYQIAFFVSMAEYWTLLYFFPGTKALIWPLFLVAVVLIGTGHFFRLGAFYSAQSSFHHLVQTRRAPEHKLITTGIYKYSSLFPLITISSGRYSRHPSYLGFYLFSLGNQLLLSNFFCFISYAVVLWKFFYDRIMYEEYYLAKFFKQEYITYLKRTPTLIPFLDVVLKKKNLSYLRDLHF